MPLEIPERGRTEVGGASPSPEDGSQVRERWCRPESVGRFYFQNVLSFGQDLSEWMRLAADDLWRNRGAPLETIARRKGSMVPVLSWRQIYRLALAVHALDGNDKAGGRRFAVLTATAGTAAIWLFLATSLSLGVLIALQDMAAFRAAALWLAALLTMAVPFMPLQARLNRFKAGLTEPQWIAPPFSIFFSLLIGGPVLAFFLVLVAPHVLRWACVPATQPGSAAVAPEPTPLVAEVPIRGASGLYTLTPPDDDWVRVDPNRFHEGTDLSLAGRGSGTKLIVWIDCDGEAIRRRVAYRRDRLTKLDPTAWIEERRELLGRPFVPISYARYRWLSDDGPWERLVATVAHGEVLIEVMADASRDSRLGESLESLVRSLKVEEEATTCRDS